jgi:anti-sigma B factor antagonist
MDFTISSHVRPPDAVIAVAGELDVFTSWQLSERLQEAVDRGCRRVMLDLAGVSFADASALGVMTVFRKKLADGDGDLQLVASSPQVMRLCQITGLDKVFRLPHVTSA